MIVLQLRDESRRKTEELALGESRADALLKKCLMGMHKLEWVLAALMARKSVQADLAEGKYYQQGKELRSHRRSWPVGDRATVAQVVAAAVHGWGEVDPERISLGKKRRRAEQKKQIGRAVEKGDSVSREGGEKYEEQWTREIPLEEGTTEWEIKEVGTHSFTRSVFELEKGSEGIQVSLASSLDNPEGHIFKEPGSNVPDQYAAGKVREESQQDKQGAPLHLGSGLLGSLSPRLTVLPRSPDSPRHSLNLKTSSTPSSASTRAPTTPPRGISPSAVSWSTPEDVLSASTLYHSWLARDQEQSEADDFRSQPQAKGINGLQVEEDEEEDEWERSEVMEGRVEGYLSMLLNRLHLHWTGIRVDYNVARSLILVAEVIQGSPARKSCCDCPFCDVCPVSHVLGD